jgi:hypothetical protein
LLLDLASAHNDNPAHPHSGTPGRHHPDHQDDRGERACVGTMPAKLSDFVVLDTIGTGSFGICKKVRRSSDGRTLVWKELDYGQMSAKEKEMLVSEVGDPLPLLSLPHLSPTPPLSLSSHSSHCTSCAVAPLAQSSWVSRVFVSPSTRLTCTHPHTHPHTHTVVR